MAADPLVIPGDLAVCNELSPAARHWLAGVLGHLGVSGSQCRELAASAIVSFPDVTIKFDEASPGDQTVVVARAIVATMPPVGQCEPLYQLILEVQGMMCGPHVPVLALDWPQRRLLLVCCCDPIQVCYEDGAAILTSINEMTLQWRKTIEQADAGKKIELPVPLTHS